MSSYWDFRDAFREVIDERYHTIEWLDEQVLSGQALFWSTDNAAIIAEIRDYPTGAKDICGLIAAGDLQEIVEVLIPQAEEYGRTLRCVAAQIESREGWSRMLRPYGYETHQIIVRKELGHGPQ